MTPIHITSLKNIAISPAHYRASLTAPFAPTRDMRIGTIVHEMVLGPGAKGPLVKYDGDRRGNAWKEFCAAHMGQEIVTVEEWEDAEPIAVAVESDQIVGPLLVDTRREHALKWKDGGFDFATGGIDVIGSGWIADLKTTRCAEPVKFQRLAINLCYPQQMVGYRRAAEFNGIDTSKGLYLFAVESSAPYCVTVLKLSDAVIEMANRSLDGWIEKYRACSENDFWPGYSQSVVDFELPGWMSDDVGLEEVADGEVA